jgi:hypothetical protein
MGTVYCLDGLDDAAYAAMKVAVKAELSFPVRLRRHTERYAWHRVDFRPTAQAGNAFTDAEIAELLDFCGRHGLEDSMRCVAARTTDKWHPSCFRQGLNYVGQYREIATTA